VQPHFLPSSAFWSFSSSLREWPCLLWLDSHYHHQQLLWSYLHLLMSRNWGVLIHCLYYFNQNEFSLQKIDLFLLQQNTPRESFPVAHFFFRSCWGCLSPRGKNSKFWTYHFSHRICLQVLWRILRLGEQRL